MHQHGSSEYWRNIPGDVCATREHFPGVKAGGRALLSCCILLAGLLSFKDGVPALHYGPAQRPAGQIPDEPRQLADLRTQKKTVSNCYALSEDVEKGVILRTSALICLIESRSLRVAV